MIRQRKVRQGPKYPEIEDGPEPEPGLTAADTKELARLVRKYGRDVVADAARKVTLRGPGRPSRSDLPYYERMHLADWIEEYAEEYRQAGHRAPLKQAKLDVYEMLYAGKEGQRDLEKFLKTIKKKHQQGRRELQEVKAAAQRREAWLRQQKGRK
jgi:hypothetical protein